MRDGRTNVNDSLGSFSTVLLLDVFDVSLVLGHQGSSIEVTDDNCDATTAASVSSSSEEWISRVAKLAAIGAELTGWESYVVPAIIRSRVSSLRLD